MKKQLLLGAFLLGSLITNAQSSCATAVDVSSGGTQTSAAISGTYGSPCWGGTTTSTQNGGGTLMANWFKYIPTSNGLLTISSDLTANTGGDTRLSIFTGTCDALECYNGNDDVSSTNYLSAVTVPVESGVTYYIAWDNYWSTTGFDFTVDFTASDCLSPNELDVEGFSDVTQNSATLSWTQTVGSVAGYDVEVGAAGFTPGTGAGMTFNPTTTSANLTGLSTTDNAALDVYLRSDCGATQGEWVGPFSLFLTATPPYANGFDSTTNALGDFTLDTGWNYYTNTQVGQNVSQSGEGFLFSNTSSTATSDSWMYSRGVYLTAGEAVNVSFYTWYLGDATDTASIAVTVGDAASSDAQTTVLGTVTTNGADDYTQHFENFTPTADGIYYFGFHQNSGMTSGNYSLLFDTFAVNEGAAGVKNVAATTFSVYPNPANNVINIANADNAAIQNVTLVDLNGRTVMSVNYDNATNVQVNISGLASGMYMMNIKSDKGVSTQKIVKN